MRTVRRWNRWQVIGDRPAWFKELLVEGGSHADCGGAELCAALFAGLNHLQLRKLDEAIRAFRRITSAGCKAFPNSADVFFTSRYYLALAFMQKGEHVKSLRVLEEALRAHANHSATASSGGSNRLGETRMTERSRLSRRSLTHVHVGGGGQAVAALKCAEIRLRSLLATNMALLGRFQSSAEEVERCFRLLEHLGGRGEESLSDSVGALGLGSPSYRRFLRPASCGLPPALRGRRPALCALRPAACALRPLLVAEVGKALGVLARERGEREAAADAFHLAKKLSPCDTSISRHLSELAIAAGEYREAENYLREAMKLAPEEVLNHLLAGEVFFAWGRWQDALSSYQKARALSRSGYDADYAHYMMAECMYSLGKPGPASRLWRRLPGLYPKSRLRHTAMRLARNIAKVGDSKRVFISDFPRILQRHDYCGPAVLAALFQFYGLAISQERIGEKVFEEGVPLHRLSKFARDAGMHVTVFSGDLRVLKRLLDAGIPVIVDEFMGMEGHYLVVIGYDTRKGTFIVRDPNYHMSTDVLWLEFKKSWRYNGNWAMVAVPERMLGRLPFIAGKRIERARIVEEVERLMWEGKLASAHRKCVEGLKRHVRHRPLLRMRVEILLGQRRWDEAEKFSRKVARRLNTFWAHKLHGDACLGGGNVKGALRSYLRARRLCAGEEIIEMLIGECKALLGEH